MPAVSSSFPGLPASLRPKAWIIGPRADFGLFIATPLILALGFRMFMAAALLPALKLLILGISSTGHHLPGIIRAYTDREIFRRFRLRLILVPALFTLLAAVCAYFRLGYILFAVIAWSIWHGSMQILGFLRIYDVKAGFQSPLTARLDFWMCLAWFVQAILSSQGRLGGVFSAFYLAGGPLLPPGAVHAAAAAWQAGAWVITAAYAANTLYNWSRRGYLNLPKLATLAVSLVFWDYCMNGVGNILVGLIMWEIFHDLQYNAFVWNYNRMRVEKGLSRSPLERFLFRADPKIVLAYAGSIVLYGCLGLLSQDLANIYAHDGLYGSLLSRIGNVFAVSALIHFYFDGFIWKVRDRKVLQDMGIEGGGSGFMRRSNLLHAAMVAVFVGAGVLMAAAEYRWAHRPGGRGEPDNLADLVPGSAYANFMKATRLKAEGKADSAATYYGRAIAADTQYAFCHAYIGEMEYDRGNWEKALPHFELAVRADPEASHLRENLGALYMRTGAYDKARAVFEGLQGEDSANAVYPYQIAFALLQMHKGLSAKPYLSRTLALNPSQPFALNYLGMIEQSQGNLDSAQALYRRAVELDSAYGHARANLAGLLAARGEKAGKAPGR